MKRLLIIVALILVLLAIGWLVYHFSPKVGGMAWVLILLLSVGVGLLALACANLGDAICHLSEHIQQLQKVLEEKQQALEQSRQALEEIQKTLTRAAPLIEHMKGCPVEYIMMTAYLPPAVHQNPAAVQALSVIIEDYSRTATERAEKGSKTEKASHGPTIQ